MQYPSGKCHDCGERLYEHVEGGYQCLNCESRYAAAELDRFDDDGFGNDGGLEVPTP